MCNSSEKRDTESEPQINIEITNSLFQVPYTGQLLSVCIIALGVWLGRIAMDGWCCVLLNLSTSPFLACGKSVFLLLLFLFFYSRVVDVGGWMFQVGEREWSQQDA